MKADFRKGINAIKKDREHGASYLTGCALDMLLSYCDVKNHPASSDFSRDIEGLVTALFAARPGMTSISNYVMKFSEEFKDAASTSRSPANLQKKGFAIATKLKQLNDRSPLLLASKAAALVKNRSIIMTCSYSDTVCCVLEAARQKGVDFKVLAVASMFKNISYGQLTAARLQKAGIICRLVPDDQIRWHTARADIILLGADAVSMQNWLLNGAPSYELARVAASRRKNIYSVCSLSKFDPRGFLAGIRDPEAGFDMVPLDLLTGLVTEAGALKTDAIEELTFEDIFRSRRARSH